MPTIDPETVRAELVRRIQDAGLAATVRALDVHETTITRIVAGGGVRRGTLMILAVALGLVTAHESPSATAAQR